MKIHGLELNDKISVVRSGEIVQARVQARGERLVYTLCDESRWRNRVGAVAWNEEGSKWCRGWEGSQVDALRTVNVLARSA